MLADAAQAWKVLEAAGVPLGAPAADRPRAFDEAQVRDALPSALAAARASGGRERDALTGWLGALRDHFPSRFTALGLHDELITELRAPMDPDRYLKLRRIALAHLAELI